MSEKMYSKSSKAINNSDISEVRVIAIISFFEISMITYYESILQIRKIKEALWGALSNVLQLESSYIQSAYRKSSKSGVGGTVFP